MAGWRFYLDGIEVEEPVGWDAVEFTAIRMESHGIDQPFSTELVFYNQGAKYIKSQYDQYFINAQIAIHIVSDVSYDSQPWEFEGFLNMAIYEETNVCDTDSWQITVGIIDDNFREEFKARQDVEISLETLSDLNGNPIEALAYRNVRLHKQDLYLAGVGRNQAVQNSILQFTPTGLSPYNWLYPDWVNVVPCFWGNTDFDDNFGNTFDTQGSTFTNSNVIFVNNATYTRYLDFNIRIAGDFKWSEIQPDGCVFDGETANVEFYLQVFDSSGLFETLYLIGSTALATCDCFNDEPTVQYDINNTITGVVVPYDYRVLLIARWGQGGSIKANVPIPGSAAGDLRRRLSLVIDTVCVNLTELNAGDYASFCNGLTIELWLNRMIYILTGSNNKLLSDVFSQSGNGCYWNNLLTTGLKIRNAKTVAQMSTGCTDDEEDQTIMKTSWKKIFEDLDKIFCLGWAFEWTGTEWKIRVEPREYFYQNQISQEFDNVGEVLQKAKVESLVNQIAIGYEDKWKNIAISGAWAIHTDRNYFVANRAMAEGSSAKLDLKSKIIAEGYAIEFSRRLSFIKYDSGSSDRPNDYEIFIIWINREELTIENVEDTTFAIPDETGTAIFAPGTVSIPSNLIFYSSSPAQNLYNIFHTPARVAGRWWKVLGMHTYGLTNRVMRFQVGEYQTTYSSAISSLQEPCIQFTSEAIISEETDISFQTLDPNHNYVLFKPIQVEFSYPQSLCDFLTLSQDEQYRKVRLNSGSLTLEGFILDASNQPEDSSGGTTKFQLLVSNLSSDEGGAFSSGFDDGYEI